MQFGGHVELHENPWSALQRELLEETGYEITQLQLLQPVGVHLRGLSTVSMHPHPICTLTYPAGNKHYHTDMCYAFITHERPLRLRADGESHDIVQFSRDEFHSIAQDEMFQNVREIITYLFDIGLSEYQFVESTELNEPLRKKTARLVS